MHGTATSSKATSVQNKPRSYEPGAEGEGKGPPHPFLPPLPARRVASRRAWVGTEGSHPFLSVGADARRRFLRNPDSPPETNQGPGGRGGDLPLPPCPCISPRVRPG